MEALARLNAEFPLAITYITIILDFLQCGLHSKANDTSESGDSFITKHACDWYMCLLCDIRSDESRCNISHQRFCYRVNFVSKWIGTLQKFVVSCTHR